MALPRMRTAKQAYEEIKALDPNTAIKLHHIQRLIQREVVPVVLVGKTRKLVNFDELLAVLSNPSVFADGEKEQSAGIRRIDERRRA